MNDLEHNTAFCALVLSLNWFMGLVASVFIDQSNCFGFTLLCCRHCKVSMMHSLKELMSLILNVSS